MKAKIGAYIGIGIGVLVAVGVFSTSDMESQNNQNFVFHKTLADPKNYENGVYTETFDIKEGAYKFGFVPNGDSPQKLTITLEGDSIKYLEEFSLVGTPHETGISTYYTWEYAGNHLILIPEDQTATITIDPNGNLMGPVTVDISK